MCGYLFDLLVDTCEQCEFGGVLGFSFWNFGICCALKRLIWGVVWSGWVGPKGGCLNFAMQIRCLRLGQMNFDCI